MADEIDFASEQSERWLKSALSAAREAPPRTAPKGRCHFCGETFEPTDELADKKLFCDSHCAQDHEKLTRLQGRR